MKNTQLTTWQAASYLAAATGDFHTDWYNTLLENRRETFSLSKKHGLQLKGNLHKYQIVICTKVAGKYVYKENDLDSWILSEYKHEPFKPKNKQITHKLLKKTQALAIKYGLAFNGC